jgi:hypothetical protein
LSPRVVNRSDVDRFGAGLARGENMVVHPTGGAEQRSGWIFAVDPPVTNAPALVLPFIKAVDDAIVLLIQRTVMRFISVASRDYIRNAGTPVEISVPWSDSDLDYLFAFQSKDVVYIGDTRRTAAMQCLRRNSLTSWAISALDAREGPWLPDWGGGVTVTPNATTGSGILLNFNSGILDSGLIGALVRIRQTAGASPNKRWETNKAVTSGDLCESAGYVYQSLTTGTTGNNSPIHDSGDVSDGAVTWRYLHHGAGVAKITGINSSSQAVADVQSTLPSTNASPFWQFGGFCAKYGYPAAGTIHQERFLLGGTLQTPDTLHFGQTNRFGPTYAEFKPGLGTGEVIDSDAVSRTLEGGRAEPILHALSARRLFMFTSAGVHYVNGASVDEPITPASIAARKLPFPGAEANVAPVDSGDAIYYVARGGRDLRAMSEEAGAQKLAVAADHIARKQIKGLAFVASPIPVLWLRLGSGELASVTHDAPERVVAFMRHPMAGGAQIMSMAAFPKPDGMDEVWAVIRRAIAGAWRYTIELMPPAWDKLALPLEKACCVDSAGYFDLWNTNGAARARLTMINADRRARVETETSAFSGGDVGVTIALRAADPDVGLAPGAAARMAMVKIDTIESGTAATGVLVQDGGPGVLNGAAVGFAGPWMVRWAKMATTLSGLGRLEGQAVSVLGDANPQTDLVVSGGQVTLKAPAARGFVGLPVAAYLTDLPVTQEAASGWSSVASAKKVARAWIVAETQSAGARIQSGANWDLVQLRRWDEATDAPPVGRAGYYGVLPTGAWNDRGQITIKNDVPLPFEVLGFVKELKL